MLAKLQPNQLSNIAVSGEILADMAEQYTNTFNCGTCPNIETSCTEIFNKVCARATQTAFDEFKFAVESRLTLPCTPLSLKMDYSIGKKVALEFFHSLAVGGPISESLAKLKQRMKEAYD